MRKHLLFVDVETSGIPDSLKNPVSAQELWPYVLQVAWQVYDLRGNLIKTEDHYLFDEKITIDKSSQEIHGLTLETLHSIGERRKDVMRRFGKDLREYQPTLVGHFVELDSKMLQVAMARSGMKNIVKDFPHFCTMLATSEYAYMPDKNFPKLDELYQRLFSEKPEQLHNALSDVKATAKCFFELARRGEVDPEKLEVSFFSKVKDKMSEKTGCGLPVLLILLFFIWILL